ncbi:hypothetical protein CPC08DRAFT_496005 [Agrocybe pediades]|nr:hypothetical protein CPC08DRAFT_496005 [Agrocybe pediades]
MLLALVDCFGGILAFRCSLLVPCARILTLRRRSQLRWTAALLRSGPAMGDRWHWLGRFTAELKLEELLVSCVANLRPRL